MTTILDHILDVKKQEVARLRQLPIPTSKSLNITPFTEKLKSQSTLGIIAEIKRASPSKGRIHREVDPVAQAIAYEQHGALAISVLTDQQFFNGTMDDLRAVRAAVSLPILCKDFIIDSIQIDHAKAAGATIILLIVAALPNDQLKNLYRYAKNQQLEVLCEVHNEEELMRVLAIGATFIGINHRNLKTFEVDLGLTKRLIKGIDNPACTVISESGIVTREDALALAASGADAMLIGETFMRSTSLQETFTHLQVPAQRKEQSI